MNVPKVRSALGWILAVAVLAVLVVPVARNFGVVRSTLSAPNGLPLILGAFLVAAYFGFRALLWLSVTQGMSVRPPIGTSVRIWFLTEFSRYLPGNVWSFLGRAGALKAEGVPLAESAAALLREALTIVASAGILLPILRRLEHRGGSAPIDLATDVAGIVGITVILVLLSPLRIRGVRLPALHRLASVLFGVCGWIAFGFGSAAILSAFHAGIPQLSLVFASIGSWLLGYISLVTPSGLGVREASLQYHLAYNFGTPTVVATALALSSRVVLIVVECVLVLAVLVTLPRTRAERTA
jgi:hypothetical protein